MSRRDAADLLDNLPTGCTVAVCRPDRVTVVSRVLPADVNADPLGCAKGLRNVTIAALVLAALAYLVWIN